MFTLMTNDALNYFFTIPVLVLVPVSLFVAMISFLRD